ncbi:hypothetical protein IQ07DRAFT_360609 [Pyrenochaeta sp. DS3sAY3a]|nr:hypothetical protein IQ07DRAFT_360609 [Pyrenochaeta sp. DS3sAY3a]
MHLMTRGGQTHSPWVVLVCVRVGQHPLLRRPRIRNSLCFGTCLLRRVSRPVAPRLNTSACWGRTGSVYKAEDYTNGFCLVFHQSPLVRNQQAEIGRLCLAGSVRGNRCSPTCHRHDVATCTQPALTDCPLRLCDSARPRPARRLFFLVSHRARVRCPRRLSSPSPVLSPPALILARRSPIALKLPTPPIQSSPHIN